MRRKLENLSFLTRYGCSELPNPLLMRVNAWSVWFLKSYAQLARFFKARGTLNTLAPQNVVKKKSFQSKRSGTLSQSTYAPSASLISTIRLSNSNKLHYELKLVQALIHILPTWKKTHLNHPFTSHARFSP